MQHSYQASGKVRGSVGRSERNGCIIYATWQGAAASYDAKTLGRLNISKGKGKGSLLGMGRICLESEIIIFPGNFIVSGPVGHQHIHLQACPPPKKGS